MPPIIRAVSGNSEHADVAFKGTRVLALDVGNKRIGVAISDELRVLARGLPTLERKSKRVDLEKIGAMAQEYGIGEIVVGHPARLGGEESAQTKKVAAFAEELRQRVSVPVRLWDERLTSVEAEDRLEQPRTVKKKIQQRRSGAVDKMAAVLILQSYLDQQKG